MPASTRPVHPRHASRAIHRRVLGSLAAATAALVGFAAVGGATYVQLAENAFDRQDIGSLVAPTDDSGEPVEPAEPTDFAAGEPINILMIGSDERNGENGVIGGRVAEGMRGDTTMVVHISGDRSRIEVMSVPRDLRVQISDCQMFDGSIVKGWTGKFNIAFANGGAHGNRAEAAACAMRTVMDLTGIDFNGHYVVADFTGFIDMINALDGVPMCIPRDMSSKDAKLDLEAGPQVLDGETALAFARARKGAGLGDGTDLMRIDRQHELLNNTIRKALGMNLLTDIPELTQFVRAGTESLTLDEQLGSISNLAGLAYHLRNFDTTNLTFVTVPWSYAADNSGDVLMNEWEAQEMFSAIANDTPLPADESLEPDPTVSPIPGVTTSPGPGSAEPTPSPTSTGPLRETQEDILAGCEFE